MDIVLIGDLRVPEPRVQFEERAVPRPCSRGFLRGAVVADFYRTTVSGRETYFVGVERTVVVDRSDPCAGKAFASGGGSVEEDSDNRHTKNNFAY